jgi:hypothetical protein
VELISIQSKDQAQDKGQDKAPDQNKK